MKIRFSSFIVLLIIAGSFSCNKYDFDYPPGTVAGSKIIYFPSIERTGPLYVAVTEGEGYADPGATAMLNGAPTDYTTSMEITAATEPGIYNISYVAQNPEGYSVSAIRVVVVVPTAVASDPAIAANDFSGTYTRIISPPSGVTSTWTKLANGVWIVQNPGGAATTTSAMAIVYNYSGTDIEIPDQNSPSMGQTHSTGAGWDAVGTKYHWVIVNSGYGPAVRTFSK